MRSFCRRVRKPGRARLGSVPSTRRVEHLSPHPTPWPIDRRPRRRPGGRLVRTRCCLHFPRGLEWSEHTSRQQHPKARWFHRRTPWPRACRRPRNSASLTGAEWPSSVRRDTQLLVSHRLTDVPMAAGGQCRPIGRECQRDVAHHASRADQAVQFFARARIPDPDVAVMGRGDPVAVGRQGHCSRPSRCCCGTSPGYRGPRRARA